MFKLRRTIYLLLASAIMLIPIYFPPLTFAKDQGYIYIREFIMTPTHVQTLEHGIYDGSVRMGLSASVLPLTLTAAALAAFMLGLAFLWNQRSRQKRWCRYCTYALLLYPIMLIYYLIYLPGTVLTSCFFSWSAAAPIAALPLLLAVQRNIRNERTRDTKRILQKEVDEGIRMEF